MTDILSAFREQGLDPGIFPLDGRIHRFKVDHKDSRKSGWAVGYSNHALKSGEPYQVVVFGNFRVAETWTFKTQSVTLTSEDQKRINQQIAKAKKLQDEARAKAQAEVAKEVAKSWESLSDTGTSSYLNKKQINNIDLGVKYDEQGAMYYAIRDFEGKIWSWQKIDWQGNKTFYAGARVSGCFTFVGKLQGQRWRFAEGFSTSASIAIATGERVVCCLSATNMERVVGEFRKHYPDSDFIICGDEDTGKLRPDGVPINTGRKTAEEVAKKFNCSTVFPTFKGPGKDWNDLHANEGIEQVAIQLEETKVVDKLALYALGFNKGGYYFTSTQNRQITELQSFGEDKLLTLMPLKYWEAVFPGDKSRVDWSSAKSELIEKCQAKGIFHAHNVRGAGVWMDAGRVVVNMGDHLLVDGGRVELGSLKSRYFYTLGTKLPALHPEPLTEKECEVITGAAHTFKWKRADFGFLLAGAMVTMRVCGALPIRPHTWITGEKGTGKTTLFNRFIEPLLGQSKIYAAGNSTEAGIRQRVNADAVPLMVDEFENRGPKAADIIQSVLDLLRVAWSETNAVILKGTSGGTSQEFQVRCAAIVTSIMQVNMNDADSSRFSSIELAPHDNDAEHWKKLDGLLNLIDEEFGNRLFARTISMMPILLANFKTLKKALNRKSPGQRFGDQYGMLLAGYSLLVQDDALTDAQADYFANQVTLDEARETAKISNQLDAKQHLVTTRIQFETMTGRDEMLIGEMIERVWRRGESSIDQYDKKALLRLGIRVDLNFVYIAVPLHAEQEARVWRQTQWSKVWSGALKNLTGAVVKNVKIDGQTKRCIVIHISEFVN